MASFAVGLMVKVFRIEEKFPTDRGILPHVSESNEVLFYPDLYNLGLT
jgi:hypothetical protein